MIEAQIAINNTTGAEKDADFGISKNGTLQKYYTKPIKVAGNSYGISITHVLSLNAGDYISLSMGDGIGTNFASNFYGGRKRFSF